MTRETLRRGGFLVALVLLFCLPALAAPRASTALGPPRAQLGGEVVDAAPAVAVVIQDDINVDYTQHILPIQELIRNLPRGSRVMVALLTPTGPVIVQPFTDNLELAAGQVFVPRREGYAQTYFLYEQVGAVLQAFAGEPSLNRNVILLADGLNRGLLDEGEGPSLSPDLNAAIAEAQTLDVRVFALFRPSLATSYNRSVILVGANPLRSLAGSTGGAFFLERLDARVLRALIAGV